MEKLIQILLTWAPIILTLILLGLSIWKIDNKERFKFISTILASLLFLLINLFLTPNKDPDYYLKNRPYLEIKLVVENSDNESFNYYYLVKNTGQLPAEDINFTFVSPVVKGSELEPSTHRILSPNGGEMKYVPNPLKTKFKDLKSFNKFVLIISFEAKIKDETKYFVSTYKNIIPSDVRDGIYTYDECTLEERKIEPEEKLGIMEYDKIMESFARFPGISFNLFLKLSPTKEIREKYIWDIGTNYDNKRLSLFLDENNYLVFRIIGELGNIASVKFDAKSILNKGVYINAEVGRKPKESFIRLGCNGHWLDSKQIEFETEFVEEESFFKWSILGADLSGHNGGVFFVTDILIYSATLTSPLFNKNMNYFSDKYKEGSKGSVYFDGNDWMHVKDPNNPLRR